MTGPRLRRHHAVLLAAVLLAAAGCGARELPGSAAPGLPPFDPVRFLEAPPADDSRETREELERILAIQARLTPEAEAEARADAELSLFRLLPEEGEEGAEPRPGRPASLQELSERVAVEVLGDIEPAKQAFARPRPFVLDPAIRPCTAPPRSFSYPSGHAAFAVAGALVLAELAPEWEEPIRRRARRFARNRVVCGVHYPSDVAAGERVGRLIGRRLLASPEFVRALGPARRDLRALLDLPPDRAPLESSAGQAPVVRPRVGSAQAAAWPLHADPHRDQDGSAPAPQGTRRWLLPSPSESG